MAFDMQLNFRFLRNPANSVEQIKDYIHNRLPRGVGFSKEDIKVSSVWYHFNNLEESTDAKPGFLLTRKIVLERSQGSKTTEGLKAFFMSCAGLGENYSVTEQQEFLINGIINKLLGDEGMYGLEGKVEINKVFYTCKTITHYVSLVSEHQDGPYIQGKTGVEIASQAGTISNKMLQVVGVILSLFAAFFGKK